MAYAKKFAKRNSARKMYGKRRRYTKAPYGNALSLARKAWKGFQMIRGMVNVEKKFINTSIATTPGSSAAVDCLNICAQGNTDITRSGESILAKHITISGHLAVNASNTTGDLVRQIIFLDKENRGAAPGWTDLMTAETVQSMTNLDNLDRFVILKDTKYSLQPASGGKSLIPYKHYINLDLHMKYGADASNITGIRQNGIFIAHLGIDNTNKTSIYGESRLAFYDN